MTQFIDSYRHRTSGMAAKLALAVACRLMTATLALNAWEQPVEPSRENPLEVARRFESLTAGGLFNPAEAIPSFPQQSSATPDEFATSPSPSPDRGLR